MAMNFVLFYLHFAILTQAGPGAAFVSHAFQNSLQVNQSGTLSDQWFNTISLSPLNLLLFLNKCRALLIVLPSHYLLTLHVRHLCDYIVDYVYVLKVKIVKKLTEICYIQTLSYFVAMIEMSWLQISLSLSVLRYGSQFSLRQSDLSCWLHSHDHTYPLKYPDGRGSSYQQQVTCYEFHDPNNIWALRRPGEWVKDLYENEIREKLYKMYFVYSILLCNNCVCICLSVSTVPMTLLSQWMMTVQSGIRI